MSNTIIYLKDRYRQNHDINMNNGRITSEVKFINEETGELLFEPLHNKTVIAGSALTAMKLFNFSHNVLDNTPTYDIELGLDNGATGQTYPTESIKDSDGNVIGSIHEECQRKIIGFCVGQGGAGLDISDVFNVKYCDRIEPDYIIPFRYPLKTDDAVDEDIYKGKKGLILTNGQERNAYYFKVFSNNPVLTQNYTTSIGSFSNTINPSTVYVDKSASLRAQTYVELHLKITKDDCREFFIAHKGIESAKLNQISLVSAWTKTVSVTKLNSSGNLVTKDYEYFQDIRPFSLLNIGSEILSDLDKSISIIYTLYF